MTKVLKLALLGRLRLRLDDEPLAGLVSGKAQALLCYLAINGRAYSRQSLAGLLWGEMPEADARRNLRGVLMRLRHAIDPYLTITHQDAAFNHASRHWLDVAEFKRLLQGYKTRDYETRDYETAVSLYRGDFLEEFHVRQAPLFENWVIQQREELRQMVLSAYQALVAHHAQHDQSEQGIAAARRLLQLDPAGEAGHRELIKLLARSGQRSAALAQYETCRQILADELGVEPDPTTLSLVEAIRSGEWGATHSSFLIPHSSFLSPQPFIAGPPISHPRQFFGRQREIKRIFNLLGRLPLQNAAIIGERRSGKTSLLHYLRTITATSPAQLRPGQRHDWLPDAARYRWIFVDFQDPRLGQAANLLHYLLEQMGLPCGEPCDLDSFLDIVSDNLHTPAIILFDEIGAALERYPQLDDAFWESLRSLATNQVGGNLAFILAAHESPTELARHGGLGSPFFNIFGYTAVLGPFTDPEARELIAAAPIPFPQADVDWILAQSGRWPMPLQILCRERLLSLEEGETNDAWREEGLRQMEPFK